MIHVYTLGPSGIIVNPLLIGSECVSSPKPRRSARNVSLRDAPTTSMLCPRKPNSERTDMCCNSTRMQYSVGRTAAFSRSLHSSNTRMVLISRTRYLRTRCLSVCTGEASIWSGYQMQVFCDPLLDLGFRYQWADLCDRTFIHLAQSARRGWTATTSSQSS